MGRISASVTIGNVFDPAQSIRCDALVDTGASHLVLPSAWRDRLAGIPEMGEGWFETATQATIPGKLCGPARIQIEGFPPIHSDIVFIDREPEDGAFDPMIGYIVLEQSGVAVDMVGHRLLRVDRFDLK